ncbi:LPXTG cell wall anchor domain-containing protein [Micromonospora craniellae]|uniref:LPXTG cell wall anchor domain-containing protein n=1 Tax=Micromonospora craniellae TaxID=2294034 RepID=A0A372FXP4_9ACTN|nr:LPXTG cell wall anchor domain-containing protein [Micromonospora craniellae]QOC91529.1 LPXTG cell wall anchor domain-containing protein [Micromonospora craniellae]RFS45478.1 LPXTG cell wall anchor domain-containing protein [Micromonospora craniellae]
MSSPALRRRLAGVAVVGVLVATAVGGAPAAAEPTAAPTESAPTAAAPAALPRSDIRLHSVTVAPGGPRKWMSVEQRGRNYAGTYVMRVDRSDVMAFADVRHANGPELCTTTGPVLDCSVTTDSDTGTELFSLLVTAAADAKPGRRGEVVVTVTEPRIAAGSYRATVTVGEGVDLVSANGRDLRLDSSLGARVDVPLAVSNRGTTTAHGLRLYVSGSLGFTPSKRYKNCEYEDPSLDDSTFVCEFADSLKPGETVRVDSTFGGTVSTDSWAPNLHHSHYSWFTPADWEEHQDRIRKPGSIGPRGTDEALTLVKVDEMRARSHPQTDIDGFSNDISVRLTVAGDMRGDVAAEGATVRGAVGATVPMRVGYLNNGPASAGANGQGGLQVPTHVTLPDGVTAVSVPTSCLDLDSDEYAPGKPGGRRYVCQIGGTISKGERVGFEFGLRLDRAGSQTGKVKLHTRSGDGPTADLDPDNDTAAIRVNPTGGGAGGELPITGTSTGLLAGTGLLLVVAGAGGYLLARRRQTRFIA